MLHLPRLRAISLFYLRKCSTSLSEDLEQCTPTHDFLGIIIKISLLAQLARWAHTYIRPHHVYLAVQNHSKWCKKVFQWLADVLCHSCPLVDRAYNPPEVKTVLISICLSVWWSDCRSDCPCVSHPCVCRCVWCPREPRAALQMAERLAGDCRMDAVTWSEKKTAQ